MLKCCGQIAEMIIGKPSDQVVDLIFRARAKGIPTNEFDIAVTMTALHQLEEHGTKLELVLEENRSRMGEFIKARDAHLKLTKDAIEAGLPRKDILEKLNKGGGFQEISFKDLPTEVKEAIKEAVGDLRSADNCRHTRKVAFEIVRHRESISPDLVEKTRMMAKIMELDPADHPPEVLILALHEISDHGKKPEEALAHAIRDIADLRKELKEHDERLARGGAEVIKKVVSQPQSGE